MKKLFKRYKKAIATILLLIILGALGYWAYLSYQNRDFEKQSTTNDTEQVQTIPTDTSTITEPETVTTEKPQYAITGLNKAEGDYFLLPDNVSYTVTPTVEKTRITLTTNAGQALYLIDVQGSSADEIIYMNGRVSSGTKGSLKIEGLIENKVVVWETIGVLF